jgi:hypothetical protein
MFSQKYSKVLIRERYVSRSIVELGHTPHISIIYSHTCTS